MQPSLYLSMMCIMLSISSVQIDSTLLCNSTIYSWLMILVEEKNSHTQFPTRLVYNYQNQYFATNKIMVLFPNVWIYQNASI